MAIRKFKPTTSTRRTTKLADRSMLERDGGPKNLTIPKRRKLGGIIRVRLLLDIEEVALREELE